MTRDQAWCLVAGIMAIALVVTPMVLLPPQVSASGIPRRFGSQDSSAAPATSSAEVPSGSAAGTFTDPGIMAAPLLGRPTDHSVNVNILPGEDLTLRAEYWVSTRSSLLKTPDADAKAGVPVNIPLTGLDPDTSYAYQLCTGEGPGEALCGEEYSFHTQRSPGSAFVFDVQADSHLDGKASGDLYLQALENELDDRPDFLIDLGDTFMTEKEPAMDNGTFLARYLLQRSYLDTVGHSVPLFLVLGNHDGESGYNPGSIATASLGLRKMYFPNPEPDGFYTGNPAAGDLSSPDENYFAWEWGDALFVVIDPYSYTTSKPGGKTDGWGWTLGEAQYQWLASTLGTSTAKYRFVFAHHLVGGDAQGRGGTEYASLYEWGGRNPDGSWGFDAHRPGWGRPIHQLLVEENVTAFFHGHDHFFAMQELDGVVYQEVPQPATLSSGKGTPGSEYGYVSGVRLASPGHLRVTVSPVSAKVEYIASRLLRGTGGVKNGAVLYSYILSPGDLHGGWQEG